jgi:hypothetical protein
MRERGFSSVKWQDAPYLISYYGGLKREKEAIVNQRGNSESLFSPPYLSQQYSTILWAEERGGYRLPMHHA